MADVHDPIWRRVSGGCPALSLLAGSLWVAVIGGLGCGPQPSEEPCTPGATQPCVCPGDQAGAQTCNEQGTGFGACDCPGPDAASVVDAAVGSDTATADRIVADRASVDAGVADRQPVDRVSPGDAAIPVDSAMGDGAMGDRAMGDRAMGDRAIADGGVIDSAARDAGAVTDLGLRYDANFTVDVAGRAGVGEPCSAALCLPGLMCVGRSPNLFCRLPCEVGGDDCDPNSENCIEIQTRDEGACVPGLTPPASCTQDPCAEIYICLAPSGSEDYRCRYRCDPQAVDAGCVAGVCIGVVNQDGGGCI